MLYGLYTSGLGAIAQSVRLDVIANNIANLNTPGFRRDQISFRERLTEALEDIPDFRYYNALVDRHGGAPFIDSIRFDSQAGGYEQTGRPLDVAIQGDGFFAVREAGNPDRVLYTRAGNFLFNSQGRLVTADGRYEVLNTNLSPIDLLSVEDVSPDFVIDQNGTLYQAGEAVGTLGVRDFDDYSKLLKQGDQLFEDLGAGPREATGYRVDSGFLESSSANPLTEMTEMIKALRILESNLQMIRVQDSTLDRAVNDFGRVAR